MITAIKKVLRHIYHWGGSRKRYKIVKNSIKIQKYKTMRCGNEYGGFDVFSEPLLSKDNIVVYSFGIGEDLSFSEDILKNFSAEIYAFDPTPKAINYVKNSAICQNAKFHFCDCALSSEDGKDTFYLPINENYVSGSMIKFNHTKDQGIKINKKRLKTIINELGHEKIDILKIDIEGSEFDVIDDIISTNIVFEQLCLEVHDRFFEDGSIKLENLMTQLSNAGFILVSMSDTLEALTFILDKK